MKTTKKQIITQEYVQNQKYLAVDASELQQISNLKTQHKRKKRAAYALFITSFFSLSLSEIRERQKQAKRAADILVRMQYDDAALCSYTVCAPSKAVLFMPDTAQYNLIQKKPALRDVSPAQIVQILAQQKRISSPTALRCIRRIETQKPLPIHVRGMISAYMREQSKCSRNRSNLTALLKKEKGTQKLLFSEQNGLRYAVPTRCDLFLIPAPVRDFFISAAHEETAEKMKNRNRTLSI